MVKQLMIALTQASPVRLLHWLCATMCSHTGPVRVHKRLMATAMQPSHSSFWYTALGKKMRKQRYTQLPQIDEIRQVQEAARAVRQNASRVIVGKEEVIDLLMVALLCEGHVLFEDVPGIGKTTLAKTMARSLGCTFQRIQFTPDLLPSDITGITFFNQKKGEFEFRPGPLLAQVVLADEINRATPRTQSALLEAMEERQITIERETLLLPRPFIVVATQNPIELEGTFPLPEAQLDRFLMRLRLDYPSQSEERLILQRFN